MRQRSYILLGSVFALFGFIFYANFRPDALLWSWLPHITLFHIDAITDLIPSSFVGWLPSSIFTFALIFLSLGLNPNGFRKPLYHIVFWTVFSLSIEFMQLVEGSVYLTGTFSLLDVIAVIVAGVFSYLFVNKARSTINLEGSTIKTVLMSSFALIAASGSAGLGIEGYKCTHPNGDFYQCGVAPEYAPMSVMRGKDAVFFSNENATEMTQRLIDLGANVREYEKIKQPGKLYVYQNYLLVNDKFNGVYVFDNSTNTDPKFIAFIRVLGSQDMLIKNGMLYLDSFVDVVHIDIDALLGAEEVSDITAAITRTEKVLNPPQYDEFLPSGFRFEFVDHSKGIVIGYRTESSHSFYFWDMEI